MIYIIFYTYNLSLLKKNFKTLDKIFQKKALKEFKKMIYVLKNFNIESS
jgi:hypothetical protein